MKYLVTGAAGFIGFHVCNELLKQGKEVIGIDNLNDYYDVNLKKARLKILKKNKNFLFSKIDIKTFSSLKKIFKSHNPEVVLHLAAQAGVRYSIKNPREYFESNSLGTFNILENVRAFETKSLIIASTSSVYGANTTLPFSEEMTTDHPIQFYAATKKNCETMAHSYSHLFKIPTTILRFFTVYGPWGRPDMALFKFTKSILENKPIEVFNNGNHKRDFTYISDISNVLVKITKKIPKPDKTWNSKNPKLSFSNAPFKIFNVGNGKPIKLNNFISHLEYVLGKKAIKVYKPYFEGDIVDTHSEIKDLKNYINYNPKINYKTGIEKFVDWYRDFYKI